MSKIFKPDIDTPKITKPAKAPAPVDNKTPERKLGSEDEKDVEKRRRKSRAKLRIERKDSSAGKGIQVRKG
jgi:hypothetical protein